MKYTKVATDTFQTMVNGAGVLAIDFDPTTGTLDVEDILGATSGGINFHDAPEFSDYGEDIDNVKKNTAELKKITDRAVTMSGTFVALRKSTAEMLMTAADTTGDKIVPRDTLKASDFKTLWLITDYSDINDGNTAGFFAIKMTRALSTGGFQLQTTDAGKGQFAFEFTGHYTINEDTVPYEVYVREGTE